jgi:phosphoenolpyruvate carboxykinase (ATP)
MRCAYPMHYISNASENALGGHPKNIIMLTCDAFGVLPPIARLTPAQAMYHFLSGFTAKVAGTERGLTEPEPTFSTCFGAPFMPRRPEVYGNLLRDKIAKHGATCWLVNTGWTGGAYGTGSRMPIKATRALLTAALDGSLSKVEFRKDPNFGFDVPVKVPGVPEVDEATIKPQLPGLSLPVSNVPGWQLHHGTDFFTEQHGQGVDRFRQTDFDAAAPGKGHFT